MDSWLGARHKKTKTHRIFFVFLPVGFDLDWHIGNPFTLSVDYSGNLNEQIHYAPHESERSVFTQGIYGTFFELGFKVQILDYYMNN